MPVKKQATDILDSPVVEETKKRGRKPTLKISDVSTEATQVTPETEQLSTTNPSNSFTSTPEKIEQTDSLSGVPAPAADQTVPVSPVSAQPQTPPAQEVNQINMAPNSYVRKTVAAPMNQQMGQQSNRSSGYSSQSGSAGGQNRMRSNSGTGQQGSGMRQSYQNRNSQGYSSGGQSQGYQGQQNGSYTVGYGQSNGNQQQYGGQNSYNRPTFQQEDLSHYTGETVSISGMLEVLPDYGVIRQKAKAEDNLPRDVYISLSQIKRFNIRMGDFVKGTARPPKEGERYLSLIKIESIEGFEPEAAKRRPNFTELTPIFPQEWLKLETTQEILSTRLIDLVSPIGKGQRAMVVAPPKAGKTWLLKDIANGITSNHPDVILFVALIGERPEEVTHFSRSVKGEVFASNFDERAEEQTRVAELCLERAKRLAERGKDVVILMDSLTRLARAYNMVAPPSGRTLTGGFDPAALYPAKHFFGAARNFEEAGSLTIIATALVDTGSRMDDVIFEEFKGTGNMELRLDRGLAERRVYPAIDIKASSTRHEEQLFDKDMLEMVFRLRRMVDLIGEKEATDRVLDYIKKAKSNKEFLQNLHKGAQ